MQRVLIHPLASVLSAFGIGVADRLAMRRASLRLPLTSAALDAADVRLHELERQARDELATYSTDAAISVEHWLELRAGDSETSLSVPASFIRNVLSVFRLHI